MGKKTKKKVQWRRLSLNDSPVQPCQGDFNCNSDFHEVSRSPTPHCDQDFSKDSSELINSSSKRTFYSNDRRYCNAYEHRGFERSGSAERDFPSKERHHNSKFSARSCPQGHHRPYRDGVHIDRKRQFRQFPRQGQPRDAPSQGVIKRRWSEDEYHSVEYFQDGVADAEIMDESSELPSQPVHTVLVGNEEYTKIQTPRQEVMFRKSFFDRKRDSEDNFSVTSTTGGDMGSIGDSVEDSLSTSEDLNADSHTETAVFDDPNYIFAGEPGKPPLAGVVMQQAYPGGPLISIPVHWTPFIDPNLIPGDTALTTLDPSFTHIIDPKTLPPDSAHILPVQHDANGCPVTVQVKLDPNGVPVEIEPSTFTVSLSSLNPRQQETILQQTVHPISNMISQVPDMAAVPESSVGEIPLVKGKEGSCLKEMAAASLPTESAEDTEKRENKDSEDCSSDSQYASMSEASTTPTTPAGELSFLNESSQDAPLETEAHEDTESVSQEAKDGGDHEATREVLLSRGDSLLCSEASELEVEEHSSPNICICNEIKCAEDSSFEKGPFGNSDAIPTASDSDSAEISGEPNALCSIEDDKAKEEAAADPPNPSHEDLKSSPIEKDSIGHLDSMEETSIKTPESCLSSENGEQAEVPSHTRMEEPPKDSPDASTPSQEPDCAQTKTKRGKKAKKSNLKLPTEPTKENLGPKCEPSPEMEDDVFASSSSEGSSDNVSSPKPLHRPQKKSKKERGKRQPQNQAEQEQPQGTEEQPRAEASAAEEGEVAPADSARTEEEGEATERDRASREDRESKPGYVVVPILTPYYDPAILYGYPLVMPDQPRPEKPFVKARRKKFKKYSEGRHSTVFLDTELYTGEPYMATPNGYLVPLESQQLCQVHGYQFANGPFSPAAPESGFVAFDQLSYMDENGHPSNPPSPKKSSDKVPTSPNKKDSKKTDSNDLSDSGVSESEENLPSSEKFVIDSGKTSVDAGHSPQEDRTSSNDQVFSHQDSLSKSCNSDSVRAISDDSSKEQQESLQQNAKTNSELTSEKLDKTGQLLQSKDTAQSPLSKAEDARVTLPSTNEQSTKAKKLNSSQRPKDSKAKPATKTPKENSRKRNKSKGKNKTPKKDSPTVEKEVALPISDELHGKDSATPVEPDRSPLREDDSLDAITKQPSGEDVHQPSDPSEDLPDLSSPDALPDSDDPKQKADPSLVFGDPSDLVLKSEEQCSDSTEKIASTVLPMEQSQQPHESKSTDENAKVNSVKSSNGEDKQTVATEKTKSKADSSRSSSSSSGHEQNSEIITKKVKPTKPKVCPKVETVLPSTEAQNKTPNGRKPKNVQNKKNKASTKSSNSDLFSQISEDDILCNDIQKIQDHILPLLAKESMFIPKTSHPFSKAMQQFSPFMYNEDPTYTQITNNRIYISPHVEKDRPHSKKDPKRKLYRQMNSLSNFDFSDFETSELTSINTSPVGFGSIDLELLESRVAVARKGSREEVGGVDSNSESSREQKETGKDLKVNKRQSKSKGKKNKTSVKEAEKQTVAKSQEQSKSSGKKRSKKLSPSPSPNPGVVKSEKPAKKHSGAKFDTYSKQMDQKPPDKFPPAQDPVEEIPVISAFDSFEENAESVESPLEENETTLVIRDCSKSHSECSFEEKSDSQLLILADELREISLSEKGQVVYTDEINPSTPGADTVSLLESNKDEDELHLTCAATSDDNCVKESLPSRDSSDLSQDSSIVSNSKNTSPNIMDVPLESEIPEVIDDITPKDQDEVLGENSFEDEIESTKTTRIEDSTEQTDSPLESMKTCGGSVEEKGETLKNLGVTEAVKRWIREVTPEKAFVLPEVNQGDLLSPVESEEEEFIEDFLQVDAEENLEQMPKNVIGNPTVASPSEEGLGACGNRVANRFQGFVLDSFDDFDKTSIVSSIISRGQLYSESSFSLPVSAELSFDDEEDDSHRDLTKYDPSIYSKYYQLGVGVDSPTPVASSRASSKDRDSSIMFGSEDLEVDTLRFIEEPRAQDPSSYRMSLATELFKAEKTKANMSHISQEESKEDLPTPICGAVSDGTLASPLSSGIGSSLASSPTNTPSHKPQTEEIPSVLNHPLKNPSVESGPLPCKTVCCSLM